MNSYPLECRARAVALLRHASADALRLAVVLGAVASLEACHHRPPPPSVAPADFVTMERTTCYGTCAAYVVTIAAPGNVTFDFHGRLPPQADTAHTAQTVRSTGTADPARFMALLAFIDSVGFFTLPGYPETAPVCTKAYNTDFPSATVSVSYRGRTHSVEHYLGCHAAPHVLWAIESKIDSVAKSSRYLHNDFGMPFGSTFLRNPTF